MVEVLGYGGEGDENQSPSQQLDGSNNRKREDRRSERQDQNSAYRIIRPHRRADECPDRRASKIQRPITNDSAHWAVWLILSNSIDKRRAIAADRHGRQPLHAEPAAKSSAVGQLDELLKKSHVTLLYTAHDMTHSRPISLKQTGRDTQIGFFWPRAAIEHAAIILACWLRQPSILQTGFVDQGIRRT